MIMIHVSEVHNDVTNN